MKQTPTLEQLQALQDYAAKHGRNWKSKHLSTVTAFPLFQPIERRVSKDDQDVNFYALFDVSGHKVRVRIRSNSYKFQCSAVAEVWSLAMLKWNEVATINHGLMQTPDKLCYKQGGEAPGHFKADTDTLLQSVAATLL